MDNASTDKILYMFAIVPPKEISAAIHKEHITVCPHFVVNTIIADAFERQMSSIQLWANKQNQFEILLDGFALFPNPNQPALIINIVDNVHLQNMQKSFSAYLKVMKFRKCSPRIKHHITIGYKDIPAKAIPAIKEVYTTRSFQASFKCDHITLWKHDRVNWRTAANFKFN